MEHKNGTPAQQYSAVNDAVVHKQFAGSRQLGDGFDEQCSAYREHCAQTQHHQDNHREVSVRQLGFVFSHSAGYYRTAAGPQHKTGGGENHGHRKNDVDRRQSVFTHKIGDKQAVHHAVNRGENHHNDGRQSEAQ